MKTLKNPLMTARQRKKGFTLTEIAIVLGIIGLILGAIWSAAASVYNNQRNTHANNAIMQVAQGVRSLMATSTSIGVAGDVTSQMVSAGIIPADLINGAGANGPWPGSTMKVLTVAATDTAFTVEMNNITQSGCTSLMTNVAGASRDPGLTGVGGTSAAAAVAGVSAAVSAATAGTALTVSNTPLALPVTATNAVKACSAATSTNLAQFEFTIK